MHNVSMALSSIQWVPGDLSKWKCRNQGAKATISIALLFPQAKCELNCYVVRTYNLMFTIDDLCHWINFELLLGILVLLKLSNSTNELDNSLMLLIGVQDEILSNLGQDTNCSERFSSPFSRAPKCYSDVNFVMRVVYFKASLEVISTPIC
jgi:hypothetical protein